VSKVVVLQMPIQAEPCILTKIDRPASGGQLAPRSHENLSTRFPLEAGSRSSEISKFGRKRRGPGGGWCAYPKYEYKLAIRVRYAATCAAFLVVRNRWRCYDSGAWRLDRFLSI